ncbi:hypothetical protein JCM10212_006078 [Sporobolomyces blumeae]
MPSRTLVTIVATLLTLASTCHAQSTDSNNSGEERNIAGYDPSIALSVVAIVLYGLSGGLHWYHFFRNRVNKFMLVLPIGMTCMVIGFVLRIIYAGNVSSILIYAIMTLFILLSPCAFLATNYVLLSRLAAALGAEAALFIRAKRIVKIFVWADVVTFLLQATGGGLSANASSADLGHKIALVGLALQLVSFGLFSLLLLVFGLRVPRKFPEIARQVVPLRFSRIRTFSSEPITDWRKLWYLLILSSVGIIVRSVFRIVEYTQGYDGYIPTHEGYFWLLDALPLWLGMTLYSIVWPGRFIDGAQTVRSGFDDGTSSPTSANELKLASSERIEMGRYCDQRG